MKGDWVVEFERMIEQFEKRCSEEKHDAKMRLYDIGHLRMAWLCDECDREFREKWNEKVEAGK